MKITTFRHDDRKLGDESTRKLKGEFNLAARVFVDFQVVFRYSPKVGLVAHRDGTRRIVRRPFSLLPFRRLSSASRIANTKKKNRRCILKYIPTYIFIM